MSYTSTFAYTRSYADSLPPVILERSLLRYHADSGLPTYDVPRPHYLPSTESPHHALPPSVPDDVALFAAAGQEPLPTHAKPPVKPSHRCMDLPQVLGGGVPADLPTALPGTANSSGLAPDVNLAERDVKVWMEWRNLPSPLWIAKPLGFENPLRILPPSHAHRDRVEVPASGALLPGF